MIDINDYFYFVKVVEHQGYSSASKALNIPKSKISRHVAKLEERLGQRLLQRTSRHFNTTEAGDAFYLCARKVIDAMEVAENAVLEKSDTLAGTVTLSSSVGVANFLLKDLVTGFSDEHPDVVIRQHVSNDYVDIIPAGFDMVIRGHSASLPDSSYIQKKLAVVEWQLFASPSFLSALNFTIRTPDDLSGLKSLGFGWQSKEKTWTLRHVQGEQTDITYTPGLCSDDMWTLKHASEHGGGIVSLPSYVCKEEVANGSLIRVLPEYTTANAQLSILLPSRTGVSEATRAFSTYLCENAPALAK
ncbi:LysR substrate-binding domain-containing protein [Alteromonas antoniana]|uniref:LysR substrate-binding domain-containing protein n=1 Tax=Alteromonas antoniana TaxID=2803813 RepID=UPI001C465671|nr:LysR substrate-binding domain-containing protein [Alteromonas antoniana]